MRALVSLIDNCGTNPDFAEWSWSTETAAPGLLSVSFLIDTDLFPFVLHCILLAVTNMHGAQRGKSYFKYINLDGRTPIFASLNMDLVWK